MAEEPTNLANAAVILGCIYFIQAGASKWLWVLVGFALGTWGIYRQTKEQKKLVKLHLQKMDADIKNLNAGTAITIANAKLVLSKVGT